MLGNKSQSSPSKMTSVAPSRKRRPTACKIFDGSTPDVLPRKRIRSAGNELEGPSPNISTKCFYNRKQQHSYQTPLERQKRREELGETFPSKLSLETLTNIKSKKVPTYMSFNVNHIGKGIGQSQRTVKTVQKTKTKPADVSKTDVIGKSQSGVLVKSTTLARSSADKKATKKSPRKRSPSKRTPRKSPRKGVKKAVKLYVQGIKKNHKAGSKPTTRGRLRKAQVNMVQKNATEGKTTTHLETKLKQSKHHKGAAKKLDLHSESPANEKLAEDTSTDDDVSVIAPSPKLTTKCIKKHGIKSKEEGEVLTLEEEVQRSPRKSLRTSASPSSTTTRKTSARRPREESREEVQQSPRKSPRTSLIKTHLRDTTVNVERSEQEISFLQGFEPETPDSVTSQIIQKESPQKTVTHVATAAFMTPPISPSAKKVPGLISHSPTTSTPVLQRKLNITKMTDSDGMEQMTMDLGQKRFGAISCETCGMVYTAAHPEDEAIHDKFHRKYLSSIKFPGWKTERVVQKFDEGRVIMVLNDDPKYHIKKVEEIRQLVDQELGFLQGGDIACKSSSKVFLFITTEKKVAGCLIAEEISKGYRVIADSPGNTDHSSKEEQKQFEQQRAWCCETQAEPAVCGISRIWVASQERRNHIATKLMDCLRNFFMFGTILPKEAIAFSDPTPDGKMFATSYMNTERFLVYKYQ